MSRGDVRRPRRFAIQLEASDHQRLIDLASSHGLTVSEYIRHATLGCEIDTSPLIQAASELRQQADMLRGLHANSGSCHHDVWIRFLASLDRLLDLAHAIAADTGTGEIAGLVERSTAKDSVPC